MKPDQRIYDVCAFESKGVVLTPEWRRSLTGSRIWLPHRVNTNALNLKSRSRGEHRGIPLTFPYTSVRLSKVYIARNTYADRALQMVISQALRLR